MFEQTEETFPTSSLLKSEKQFVESIRDKVSKSVSKHRLFYTFNKVLEVQMMAISAALPDESDNYLHRKLKEILSEESILTSSELFMKQQR